MPLSRRRIGPRVVAGFESMDSACPAQLLFHDRIRGVAHDAMDFLSVANRVLKQ
jgi:hypothetical protein